MAATLLSQLESMYPDSTRYRENYERFANRMDSLDHALQAIFADGPAPSSFTIRPFPTWPAITV